jgi:hypothetical protein
MVRLGDGQELAAVQQRHCFTTFPLSSFPSVHHRLAVQDGLPFGFIQIYAGQIPEHRTRRQHRGWGELLQGDGIFYP